MRDKKIYLVPIGKVRIEILEYLKENLSLIFPYFFEVSDEISIPENSLNVKRNQYFSPLFLEKLSKLELEQAFKILGITEVDLYVPDLNYIFGQAKIRGREALISLARLNNTFYGLPENIKLLKERAIKEAVHELGHTFGLEHCSNPKCVMFFSNSLKDTDHKKEKFCNRCSSLISQFFT
ncbi:MAG: archaemetzincin family Zn-dependent metalloprotease [Dictyoglomus sp.]|nr:archaemetzincin family Zn-dependent metalloprotease [Dictyoglomus sp.]MCX7942757.1 archaemetzincin family Zn-dependent metalloprotease [Dictyoglomaceae bacterium]MDW8187981.1 archaemetzincin family Zn-dependent metalloprotease [Dictyoglomus sp.]